MKKKTGFEDTSYIRDRLNFPYHISIQIDRCMEVGEDKAIFKERVKDLVNLILPYKDSKFNGEKKTLEDKIKEIKKAHKGSENNILTKREMNSKIAKAEHEHFKTVFGEVIKLLDRKGMLLKQQKSQDLTQLKKKRK